MASCSRDFALWALIRIFGEFVIFENVRNRIFYQIQSHFVVLFFGENQVHWEMVTAVMESEVFWDRCFHGAVWRSGCC